MRIEVDAATLGPAADHAVAVEADRAPEPVAPRQPALLEKARALFASRRLEKQLAAPIDVETRVLKREDRTRLERRSFVGGVCYTKVMAFEALSFRYLEGGEHPALLTRSILTRPPNWVSGEAPRELAAGRPMRCAARVRHPGELHPCVVELERPAGLTGEDQSDGCARPPMRPPTGLMMRMYFEEPIRGVAPMQAVALYDGEVCLGGATIHERGRTLWEEQMDMEGETPPWARHPPAEHEKCTESVAPAAP